MNSITMTAAALSDTTTAQALTDLIKQAGNTPQTVIHFLMSLVYGSLAVLPIRAYINAALKNSDNFLVRFGAPLITGTILSTVASFLLKSYGVTPQDATAAWTAFVALWEALEAGGFGKVIKGAADLLETDAPALEAAAAAAGQPALAAGLSVTAQALKTVETIHAAAVAAPPAPAAPAALPAPAAPIAN